MSPWLKGLLIVGVIVGGLCSFVVLNAISKHRDRATREWVRADTKAFGDASALFQADVGRAPMALDELLASKAKGWDGPYVKGGAEPLHDPWRRPYRYAANAPTATSITVGSLGADGAPGGEGADADIQHVIVLPDLREK